ncbi:hypothetical protein NADFUDRAFT_82175 [Nadsonia fulvescens var. elongata DSM 6958]|uniref:Uncharacterized protein n=1 Tax=Nadsonia fulvescens var. elongata DSM 6958 TaxID=857566 RepID=A0A1E3PLJ8_9ASCO|nr:hypothetical protein NADFUDRAFT_82175 [Nadsonia fulvescens var. elongata DSM 6958]
MFIKAATRTRLTTSLFSTTFLIAVFTVAAPSLFPCPVSTFDSDSPNKNQCELQANQVNVLTSEEMQSQKKTSSLSCEGLIIQHVQWDSKTIVVSPRDA